MSELSPGELPERPAFDGTAVAAAQIGNKQAASDERGEASADLAYIDTGSQFFKAIRDVPLADFEASLRFAQFMKGYRSPFMSEAEAIAALSAGQGLSVSSHSIVAIAQRFPSMLGLAVVADALGVAPTENLHLVEIDPDAVAGGSPAALELFLRHAERQGLLGSDTILILLPAWIIDANWERAFSTDEEGLGRFLAERNKRLLASCELPLDAPYSRFVNSETMIVPQSWGLPMIDEIANRNRLGGARRLRPQLVLDVEEAVHWRNAADDRKEASRAAQFLALNLACNSIQEMEDALQRFCDDRHFSPDAAWKKKQDLIDEAFGLTHQDKDAMAGKPPPPRLVSQTILCTMAFCGSMPGKHFLNLVRASLPEEARMALTDLTQGQRDEFVQQSKMAHDHGQPAPTLPLLRAYLDEHIDRLCREYEIEFDGMGAAVFKASWHRFPLAIRISRQAPMAAMGFASRLLSSFPGVFEDERGSEAVVIELLARLRFYLSSVFDDNHLTGHLIEYAFRPVVEQARSVEEAPQWVRQLVASRAEAVNALTLITEALRAEASDRLVLDAAASMASVFVGFLWRLRRISVSSEQTRDPLPDEEKLTRALLGHIGNPQFAAAFCMNFVLLDGEMDDRLWEKLLPIVDSYVEGADRKLVFVRRVMQGFLLWSSEQARLSQDTRNIWARPIAFVRGPKGNRSDGQLRQHMRDVLLEHLLSFDIRWPPENVGFVDYRHMRPLVAGRAMLELGQMGWTAETSGAEMLLMEGFFSVSPAEWLSRSRNRQAAFDVEDRIKDLSMVMLDGVPESARRWLARKMGRQTLDLQSNLAAFCGLSDRTRVEDVGALLRGIADYGAPTPLEACSIDYYGLFWPAVLMNWRWRHFGVERLPGGSAGAAIVRGFLSNLASCIPTVRLQGLVRGLGIIERAFDGHLVLAADSISDDVAVAFFTAKRVSVASTRKLLISAASPERPLS